MRNNLAILRRQLFLFVFTITAATLHHLQAQQPQPTSIAEYKLKRINLPPEKRPDVRYAKQELPFQQVGGELPTFDGEQFTLNLFQQNISSAADARRVIGSFLSALKAPLKMDENMRLNINATTAQPQQNFLEQQIREGEETLRRRITGRFKTVSGATQNYIQELSNEVRTQSKFRITVYRFDQYFRDFLIDNTALSLVNRTENGVVSLQGKFYQTVNVTNKQTLSQEEAIGRAIELVKRANDVQVIQRSEDKGELVLLPYIDGFKFVWRTRIVADGPYRIWIDAETGQPLQLLPDFYFGTPAQGLIFSPDPNSPTVVSSFEVDAASGGQYTLRNTGVLTLNNIGTDGTSGLITIADDGSGSANFNVSPINGTVVERTNQANYNGLFQQVNIFATIYNERKYYMLLGSQDFGQVNVSFNKPGGNAFCCPPAYHIGDATTGTSTGCSVVFNSGIDATVIAHEFGHNLNGLQYGVGGGTMTGALNEGMADFWADTNFNTDIFGGWWTHNCPTPVQSGYAPRQAEPLDIFPSHNSLPGASTEAHSAGQMIAWANWSTRQGMSDATTLGPFSINFNTIRAMATAGIGITDFGTAKSIHDSYLDLLNQQAPLYNHSRLVHKLLAGYARAGIFLAARDAVIDIDHSYLDRTSAVAPTFSIWTGRDYTFNSSGGVVTSSPPFNTEYMVEVANNETFTSNLRSSGWQTGVTGGDGGHATWTLPAADWTTLKAGDYLFYRVTTRSGAGSNIRQSWNPGNGTLSNVPVGKASINGTGTKDCSCSASAAEPHSAMALLPLIPLVVLVVKRSKTKRPS